MASKKRNDKDGLILACKYLAWVLVIFLVYYYLLPAAIATFKFTMPLILPFLLGLLLAALIDPVAQYLSSKLKLSIGLSTFLSMIGVVGGLLFLLIWGIVRGVAELIELSVAFPKYAEKLAVWLDYTLSQARIFYSTLDLPVDWYKLILNNFEEATGVALNFFNWALVTMTAIPNIILVLVFALLASFFFSKDKKAIGQSLELVLPKKFSNFTKQIGKGAGNAVIGYLRAQLVLMLITMGQTVIGLYLLKIDYALLITLAVGILDLLPVIGPGVIFIPWAVVAFFMGKTKLSIALIVLYGVISLVRQLLQPKILGDSIGIHPLETLISLYIGFKLFGVIGIIIGPILVVIIKNIWKYFVAQGGGNL